MLPRRGGWFAHHLPTIRELVGPQRQPDPRVQEQRRRRAGPEGLGVVPGEVRGDGEGGDDDAQDRRVEGAQGQGAADHGDGEEPARRDQTRAAVEAGAKRR